MFVKRLNEAEEAALYQTAAAGADFLNNLGFPWWLAHGTLYGSWCYHAIVPWDDDLDFAFARDHIDALEQAAISAGWKYLRLHPFHAKIWKPSIAMHSNSGRKWTWPFIDIALYDEIKPYNTILIEYNHCRRFGTIAASMLFPTKLHPFGPLSMPIPNNPEAYLDLIYRHWRTKSFSNPHNHRLERPYLEGQQWADVSELHKQFPFKHMPKASPAW